MFLRNLIKVLKLIFVYFVVDKKICVVEIKKLRIKDGEKVIEIVLERNCEVIIKYGGKLLEVMVIVVNGKCIYYFFVGELKFIFCLFIFIYVFIYCYTYFCYFR